MGNNPVKLFKIRTSGSGGDVVHRKNIPMDTWMEGQMTSAR